MREIKFRAWDKENKRFGYLDHPFDNNWYEHPSIYGTCPAVFTNNWKGKIKDDYELMQYTGLTDKNGKEIYEDDILRNEEEDSISTINWYDLNAQFVACTSPYEEDRHLELYLSDDCVVIGNVYENPELLKE